MVPHLQGTYHTTGLDLAVFHGNVRTFDLIVYRSDPFRSASDSMLYTWLDDSTAVSQARDMCVSRREQWHLPNVYSERYHTAKDYDTDSEDEMIVTCRGRGFERKGVFALIILLYAYSFYILGIYNPDFENALDVYILRKYWWSKDPERCKFCGYYPLSFCKCKEMPWHAWITRQKERYACGVPDSESKSYSGSDVESTGSVPIGDW